ncbi:MAG: hypothetical protein U0X91_03815 [Spirosomataceae bacterium]
MINVVKSQPAPECLASESQKASGDYKCGNVLERIKKDFNNKCYICETKRPTTINVEHFLPHRGNVQLKFDWNNLFYVCGHCNNTKLAKAQYDDILNCTDPKHSILELIKFKFDPLKNDSPDFEAISPSPNTIIVSTIALLEEVYEGKTILKKIEAENIRELLVNEINNFVHFATGYLRPGTMPSERSDYRTLIIEGLKPDSAFTAFKIWIVKSSPKLLQEFSQFLPQ